MQKKIETQLEFILYLHKKLNKMFNEDVPEYAQRFVHYLVKHKGLSQRQISIKTGTSEPTISAIIKGKNSSGLYIFNKLISAYRKEAKAFEKKNEITRPRSKKELDDELNRTYYLIIDSLRKEKKHISVSDKKLIKLAEFAGIELVRPYQIQY